MEFREISTFLQVAQYQSFSKAARHLGYSQAAVTIQIKQLEQELGVHLFDRIGKQISLTHQGQEKLRLIIHCCGRSHDSHCGAVGFRADLTW